MSYSVLALKCAELRFQYLPNIAEGSARSSTKELIHFLSIATGSLSELDTQLELTQRLGYSEDVTHIQAILDETTALILAMAKSLKAKL